MTAAPRALLLAVALGAAAAGAQGEPSRLLPPRRGYFRHTGSLTSAALH